MSNDNSKQEPASNFSTNKLHLFLSLAGFLAILFLAGYVGNQFQEIEDKLQHQAPVVQSPGSEINIEKGQTVYVSAYSHIYSGGGEPHLLAITLSIRNTDPERAIRIVEASYYDSNGKLVKNHIDGFVEIPPMATIDILIGKQDKKGGSGASFLVTWKSDKPVYKPIIEAIMVGLSEEHDISFMSFGKPLAVRVKNKGE